MSVPDWPTSYGYNMFLFPLSKWWHSGNIFYEHSHRLFASGVGLLTTILAIWLWVKEPRKWLRWLGVAAFFAVVLQGVLGGLRVTLFKDELGIFHATLAQLFFVLVCSIALFTSRWWKNVAAICDRRLNVEINPTVTDRRYKNLRRVVLFTTMLILAQLVLGATMRHQHAGLAIRDFPLAYGKLWPDMDAQSVARYNQQRQEVTETHPITATQIGMQMAHRIMAIVILFSVAACAFLAKRNTDWRNPVAKISAGWLGLILLQAILGVATVLSNKAADMATLHVLVGALSLMTGTMLVLVTTKYCATIAANTETPDASRKFSFASGQAVESNVPLK